MIRKVCFILLLGMAVSMVGLPAAVAQTGDTACPVFIEQVQVDLETICGAVGPDELCYGHKDLILQWQEGAPDPLLTVNVDGEGAEFSPGEDSAQFASGDRVATTWLQSVQAAVPDPEAESWGIAVLNVAAPDLSAQEISEPLVYTLYGAAVLQNDVPASEAGQNWAPFQAFRLSVDSAPHVCPDAPSGLSISAPEGAFVTLMANDVEFTIGSTVHLELVGGYLYILVTEGSATVQMESGSIHAEAGQYVRVPVDPVTRRANRPPQGPFDITEDQQALIPPAPMIVVGVPLLQLTGREDFTITAPAPAPESVPEIATLHFLWATQTCIFTPDSTITGPLLIQWGIGCFDSQVHASAHPHPADYQLLVDGAPWTMATLQQSGPHRHPPFCPWGWNFDLGPVALPPGQHELRLIETVTDTWSGQTEGRNAGEVVSMTCRVNVSR